MNKYITTKPFLLNAFKAANNMLEEHGAINVTYEKVKRVKTKKQLKFFFGGLVKAMQKFYSERDGKKKNAVLLREGLYRTCSVVEWGIDVVTDEPFSYYVRISDMSKKQMSDFISNVIDLIDNELEGCILTPDLRYLWANHITKDDIMKVEYECTRWKRLDPVFLVHTRKQACISCGQFGCDPHHLTLTDKQGTALKAPDYLAMPVCRECHTKLHAISEPAFYRTLNKVMAGLEVETFLMLNYQNYLLKLNC